MDQELARILDFDQVSTAAVTGEPRPRRPGGPPGPDISSRVAGYLPSCSGSEPSRSRSLGCARHRLPAAAAPGPPGAAGPAGAAAAGRGRFEGGDRWHGKREDVPQPRPPALVRRREGGKNTPEVSKLAGPREDHPGESRAQSEAARAAAVEPARLVAPGPMQQHVQRRAGAVPGPPDPALVAPCWCSDLLVWAICLTMRCR